MELFNALIELVKAAPSLAVWIIAIVFAYKTFIVGSVYAVVRYVVNRIATAYEAHLSAPQTIQYDVAGDTLHLFMTSEKDDIRKFLIQLHREARRPESSFLHGHDLANILRWVREGKERESKKKEVQS